jgi:uncharacterized membrane protein YraQ (UPF0718 family)
LPSDEQTPNNRVLAYLGRVDWGLVIVASLSFGSALYVLAREGFAVASHILAEDFWLFASILPKVMLGCLIGALIRLLISRETIERFVGEGSGFTGLALAGLIGMLFPAGPFTIFPLAVVLMASGADRGAAITFISAWLLVGINRAIIWEMPFFGTDFVLFRFLISLPMPILLGLLSRLPVFDRIMPPTMGKEMRKEGEP